MRRTKAIVAVAVLLVAMLVATAAPAFANERNETLRQERNESAQTQRNEENNFNCCFNGFVNESTFFPFFTPFFGFNDCAFDPDDCFFGDGSENFVFQSV